MSFVCVFVVLMDLFRIQLIWYPSRGALVTKIGLYEGILGFIKGLDSFNNCYYEIDVRTESSEKQNKNMTRCQVINSAEQIIE